MKSLVRSKIGFLIYILTHLNMHPKPGSIVGACQSSRWTVTLVDVYALGPHQGSGKRAIENATSSSILLSGQSLPYRGRDP